MTKKLYLYVLLIAMFLISLPYRLYNFNQPLLDSFNFRQTQTATIALNFYKNGINFFRTELDMFGIGKEKYVLMEFPLYQSAVAVLYRVFYFSEIWGRIVSIFSGFTGAFYLFQIVRLIAKNSKLAFLAVMFFLFTPLNLFYHRSYMIDPTIIAFLLGGMYYFLLYTNFGIKKYFLASLIFLTLGFIQKGLYGPFWLIPLTVYWLNKKSAKSILKADFLLLIIIPLSVLFIWQLFENSLNTLNNQNYFTTSSNAFRDWNFGTWQDRISVSLWQFRLQQILNGAMLKPGLILFLIGLFAAKKYDKYSFFYSFLFSQIVYFCVLFRVQTQNYYQLVIVPAIVIFMAIGLYKSLSLLRKKAIGALIASAFMIFYIGKSWQNTLPSFYMDWGWYDVLLKIQKTLPENKAGVFITDVMDWNSSYSYYLKRKLLAASVFDITENKVTEWKNKGYKFLILYDEDKSISALKRYGKEGNLSPLSRYPEIYKSDNIRIVGL